MRTGFARSLYYVKKRAAPFQPDLETSESRWFGRDELPPMALEKNTPEQALLCFDAADDPCWNPVFD